MPADTKGKLVTSKMPLIHYNLILTIRPYCAIITPQDLFSLLARKEINIGVNLCCLLLE